MTEEQLLSYDCSSIVWISYDWVKIALLLSDDCHLTAWQLIHSLDCLEVDQNLPEIAVNQNIILLLTVRERQTITGLGGCPKMRTA